jgi:hypothetical protein
MTQDKARKIAIRQRMAATGEPYSVARHAVEDADDHPVPDDARADQGSPVGPDVRASRTVATHPALPPQVSSRASG